MTRRQKQRKKTHVTSCHPVSKSGTNKAQTVEKRLVEAPPAHYMYYVF